MYSCPSRPLVPWDTRTEVGCTSVPQILLSIPSTCTMGHKDRSGMYQCTTDTIVYSCPSRPHVPWDTRTAESLHHKVYCLPSHYVLCTCILLTKILPCVISPADVSLPNDQVPYINYLLRVNNVKCYTSSNGSSFQHCTEVYVYHSVSCTTYLSCASCQPQSTLNPISCSLQKKYTGD